MLHKNFKQTDKIFHDKPRSKVSTRLLKLARIHHSISFLCVLKIFNESVHICRHLVLYLIPVSNRISGKFHISLHTVITRLNAAPTKHRNLEEKYK